MSKSYIGITLGPIFDTICEATSPAALWFASNMFSDLTQRICATISEDESVEIYSPYYEKGKEESKWDGVGKYHDRIIFSTVHFSPERLNEIIKECKANTVKLLPGKINKEEAIEFFEEYLQVHYVVKQEDELGSANCVLELSPYLDALELMKTFPGNDKRSPLKQLFAGEEEQRNRYIKESPLYQRVDADCHQLKCNNRIWEIGEIASHKNTITQPLKRKHYYAVVSADGDYMGRFLQEITNEQVTKFSKLCLEYDTTAAKMIGAYGGMTIYAGGDDLLFLAPVMTEEKDVFELCHEIQSKFSEYIKSCEDFNKDTIKIPTLSFGISIQYEKYPLYEALEHARKLLKKAKSKEKNAMCIGVQKHSGQSIEISVSNLKYENILKNILALAEQNKENKIEKIESVLHILGLFSEAFKVLDKKVIEEGMTYERYKEVWENFFDNEGQQKAKGYLEKISKIYYDEMISGEYKDPLQTLIYLLRLKHFLVEKEGEREVSDKN